MSCSFFVAPQNLTFKRTISGSSLFSSNNSLHSFEKCESSRSLASLKKTDNDNEFTTSNPEYNRENLSNDTESISKNSDYCWRDDTFEIENENQDTKENNISSLSKYTKKLNKEYIKELYDPLSVEGGNFIIDIAEKSQHIPNLSNDYILRNTIAILIYDLLKKTQTMSKIYKVYCDDDSCEVIENIRDEIVLPIFLNIIIKNMVTLILHHLVCCIWIT